MGEPPVVLCRCKKALQTIPVTQVKDKSSVTPVGSMLCLWCDGPHKDYSASRDNVYDLIKTMADSNPAYFKAPELPEQTLTDAASGITVTLKPSGSANEYIYSIEIAVSVFFTSKRTAKVTVSVTITENGQPYTNGATLKIPYETWDSYLAESGFGIDEVIELAANVSGDSVEVTRDDKNRDLILTVPHFSDVEIDATIANDSEAALNKKDIILDINGTATEVVSGVNLAGNYELNPTGIATVTVTGKNAVSGEMTIVGMSSNGTYTGVLSDGTNYMVIGSDGSISNTEDAAKATQFVVTRESASRYYIKGNGYYLDVTRQWNGRPTYNYSYTLTTSNSETRFNYGTSVGFSHYDYGRYITYNNGWTTSTESGNGNAFLYKATAPTPASTNIVFKGVAAGTAKITIGNTEYTVKVRKAPVTVTVRYVCDGKVLGTTTVEAKDDFNGGYYYSMTAPSVSGYKYKSGKLAGTVTGDTEIELTYVVSDGKIYLPVKFIDYRADGMLFDFQIGGASYPYGLVHGAGETDSSNAATSNGGTLNGSQYGAKISGTTLENTGYVPGDYYSGQWYAWGGAWSRSGLVKPNLRNGLPEYTDATITHVAKLMYAKTYNSEDMANVENFNDVIYNTFIATNATKGFKSNSTTSMSAAFTAAQTWDNIQCPYDLAYYLLNNLFREDQATVTINGKTMPINGIYVDKYKSLVLVSDGNGVYSLNAKNALRYGDTTIYEDDTSTDNTYKNDKNVEEKHFYPLDGLGYDAPDYFGDTTDMTTGRNGNFAMVSEAQFVYNPNQYFTFSGDDDVYLYINGVLALDLGGAHGVCTKTVKLSDVAAKCGLTAGKVADFKFFYMERNSSASNFSIKTNIELATPAISVDKKAYNATNGIEVNSGSALHSSVDVIYDLMVTNKGNLPMTDISFVDTDNCGNRIEFNGTESKFVNGNNSKAVINAGGPFTAWIQISDTAVRNEQTCADLAEVTAYLKTVELAPGETLHIKGIRCNLTPDNNSVFKYENNLNAKGTAGGIDLNGTAMHEIYSFEINDTSRAYVVDFGLPLRITELFDSNVAATALVTDVKLAKDQTFRYGTVELVGNKTDAQLNYTLNKTIHGAEVITLDIELTITLADGTQIKLPTTQKHITIIPATTVYYEDTFSDFIRFEGSGCSWTTDGTTVSKEQSADRIAHGGNVYGYDQAYDTMSKFSLGSAHKVTVSGSNYATAKFSFYGTGFDVISATTNTSGTIVVSVTGANGYSKNYLVDTYYGYTYDSATGKWTPAPDAAKALWQIPVMKVANLDYGKYDVTITVAYADFFSHGQNGGGSYDFWLDAVRIYDPAGAADGSKENYEKAYKADGECWPTYMELRDMIIRGNSFTADSTANGMIFIDGQTGNVSMADYTSYGPNNELYLAKGQAVAFRLNAAGNVADIQIALKAIQAGIKAHAVITTTDGAKLFDGDIATATDMYRSILAANGKTVVITNTGDGILSITNLKTTYSVKPVATDTLSLTMDEKSALAALSAVDEVLNPKTPFEPGKVDVRVEDKDITVITSPDVDGIEIDGEKVTDFTVDSETGNRIWKKAIDRILKDNPEISVVARDSNGNVSAPVTAPVVAGGSIGALIGGFIGRLIKNILSVLFG